MFSVVPRAPGPSPSYLPSACISALSLQGLASSAGRKHGLLMHPWPFPESLKGRWRGILEARTITYLAAAGKAELQPGMSSSPSPPLAPSPAPLDLHRAGGHEPAGGRVHLLVLKSH